MQRRKRFVCESGQRRLSDERALLFFSVLLDRGIIRFIGSFDVYQ
jgi:hypothetical protein